MANLMTMMNMNQCGSKPAWLQALMADTFFGTCLLHENRRKSEKNVFCLHCCLSICPHCLPSHRSHPLLQPYTINGAKVIFLNYRPQSRPCKAGSSTNACFTCDRILQEPFHFCSLSCKVDHMVYQGEDLYSILHRFDESDFSYSQFEGLRVDGLEGMEEDGQITPNSVVEDSSQQFNKSSSCSSINDSAPTNVSSGTHIFKRKNKGTDFLPAGIVLSLSSRRKGAPQRAPLS
uniref:PLATZ transcription factor family protein n=1 Tax=Cucumis melo TaxID=3656 RepID=A0A9I9CEI6_CUCME